VRRRFRLSLLAALLLAPAIARAEPPAPAPDAAPLRVYVVRHASAWKNVPAARRPGVMSDAQLDALTPAGLARAEQAGAELAGKGVVAVYTSPAHRAEQTAEAIAKRLGLAAPIVEDAFRTLDSGPDRAAASGTVRAANWKAGRDPRPAGGESLADGFARASDRLAALRAAHAGQAIAIVTHGEIAASLLAKAAGQDILRGYFDHFPDEGSVHAIAVEASGALAPAK